MAKKVTIVTEYVDKATPGLKRVEKTIESFNKKIEDYEKKQKKVTAATNALAEKNKFLVKWSRRTGMSVNRLSQGISAQGFVFNKSGKLVDAAGQRVKDYSKVMKGARVATQRFQMAWLGVMFAGMSLKRIFQGILRSVLTTFNKIMESSGQMGTNLQRLGVHWEYLKFVIGSVINTALGPLMPLLISAINKVADFAQKNPKLTSSLIIFGLVLGTVALVVGSFSLAFISTIQALEILGITVKLTRASFMNFAKSLLTFAGYLFLVLAVAVVLNGFFGDFKGFDKWAANAQKNGGVVTRTILGVFRILNFAGNFFKVAFLNVFDTIFLGISIAINGMVGDLERFINFIIKGLNRVIEAINKVSGKKIATVGSVSFGGVGFGEAAKQRIIERTTKLMAETPTLGEFFTGVAAGEGENASRFGGPINITMNVQGAGTEEVVAEMDAQMAALLAQLQSYQ